MCFFFLLDSLFSKQLGYSELFGGEEGGLDI